MNRNTQKNEKTKKETFYEIILNRIIKCEYNSNDIITEKSLVNEFKISKSPIREALLELRNEGYLTSIPRYGYQICSFNTKEIEELTEFRICLEYTSIDMNWNKINKDEVLKIKEFVNEAYKEIDKKKSTLEYWQLNTHFHLMLISLFKNSYNKEKLKNAMKILGVAYAQSYWKNYHTENIVSDCNCHFTVVNAILNDDKKTALSYLLEDITNFEKLEDQETKGDKE
jgi:DNA-binding GntR family transcriptional regulator